MPLPSGTENSDGTSQDQSRQQKPARPPNIQCDLGPRADACALTVFCCTSCQSASPAFVLTDPIDGGPVPVSCAGVDVKVCEVAASATLDYLTPDYAGVEAVRVEPLADPPAGAVFAVRVTLDHKMFLNSGLQPYRVVQTVAAESIQVTPIRD